MPHDAGAMRRRLLVGSACTVGRARAAPGDVLVESRFTRGSDDRFTGVKSQREDGLAVVWAGCVSSLLVLDCCTE